MKSFQNIYYGNLCDYTDSSVSIFENTDCKDLLDGSLTQGLYASLIYLKDFSYSHVKLYYQLIDKYGSADSLEYQTEVKKYLEDKNMIAILYGFPTTIQPFIIKLSDISRMFVNDTLVNARNTQVSLFIIFLCLTFLFQIV